MEGNHCGPGGSAGCAITPPACFSAMYVGPVFEYDHTGGNCSVTGGYVYRGTQVPALTGTYVYGDYCSGRLWGSGALFTPTLPGLSTFGEDAAGELYAGTTNGQLYRIVVAASPTATPTVTQTPTPTVTPSPTLTPTPTPDPSARPPIIPVSRLRPTPRSLLPR